MSQSKTTYSRAVFEHLLDRLYPKSDDNAFIYDFLDIRDDGVWLTEMGLALGWSPACDMDWPGSPDPLTTPALPFPFTAGELAVWLLDGPGFFVAEEAGPIATGPTKRALDSIEVRGVKARQGVKAREALTAAYAEIRKALMAVGGVDRGVDRDALASALTARWRDEQRLADRVAKKANDWTKPGIGRKQSEKRRKRYLSDVKPGRVAQREARRVASEHVDAWRKKVVRAIVGPQSTEADSATGVEHEGGVSGEPSPEPSSTLVRRRQARDVLAPLIDRVCASVNDPTDSASVWAELERLARLPEKERPTPLLGVDTGGIQWRDGGANKKLTRKALGGRLRRAEDRKGSPSLAEPRK